MTYTKLWIWIVKFICWWHEYFYIWQTPSWHDTIREAKHKLESANKWFKHNHLTLVVDKTCYTMFSKTRNIENSTIYFDGKLMHHVNFTKYLGVYMDYSWSWYQHIDIIYYVINWISYHAYSIISQGWLTLRWRDSYILHMYIHRSCMVLNLMVLLRKGALTSYMSCRINYLKY